MADVPDTLTLERNRDLVGFYRGAIWFRRGVLLILTLIAVLALANVFGQRATSVLRSSSTAALKLTAPTTVRGGDLWQARFHITAKQDLSKAILKLEPGWADGLTINTIEPAPTNESSDDGRLSFELGSIAAGGNFILFMQLQTNPTTVTWHRSQDVELVDGSTVVASIHRTITVLP